MAVTKGQGNPIWSREETILALDLYFDFEGKIPSEEHPKVIELSQFLRLMSIHAHAVRRDSFRNPAGVAFKLQNLKVVATGKGLPNKSKNDEAVWAEFGNKPTELKKVAGEIRAANEILEKVTADEMTSSDDEEEFREGGSVTRLHKVRERDKRLRRKVLAHRRKRGPLRCEICDTGPRSPKPAEADAIFEVHHDALPASAGERLTKLSDVRLLCANCHKHVHRLIKISGRWLLVSEFVAK